MTQRRLTQLRVLRPLYLVALHGPGLAHAGVAGEVTAGLDYDLSRTTALRLWRHPQAPDGIRYSCRHDNAEYAIALFDRGLEVSPALQVEESIALDTDVSLLARWVEKYGIGVI
jgi:hypothetical protein